LLTCLLVSCGAKTITIISPERVLSEAKELKRVYEEDIGRAIYEKGYYLEYDAIVIKKITQNFRISYTYFPYKVGDTIPLIGEDKSNFYYYNSLKSDGYTVGIIKSKKSDSIKAFTNSGSGLWIKDIPNLEIEETTSIPNNCNDCFKQEFVYIGRSGSTVKFLYREYSSNFIRADFTQELQYDIEEDNLIGFQGLRLQIFETTNTSITYRILQNMD
jgi:hypothetical protein